MTDEQQLPETTQESTSEAPSLDATLDRAWDELQARDAQSVEAAAEQDAPSGDRPRDELGRFAKAAAPDEASTETPTQKETTDQAPEQATAPAQPASEAPASWSDAAKAEWAKLPPAIQQEVARREADVSRYVSQAGPALQAFDTVVKALEPVAANLKAAGITAPEYISRLVSVEAWLQRDPPAALQWLAQQYGHSQAQPAEHAAEVADPQLAAVLQRVATLEQSLQQSARSQEEQVRQRIATDIEAFKAAVGADGKPARPHFDRVRVRMAQLIHSGEARGLDDAYARAVSEDAGIKAEQRLADLEAQIARDRAEAEKRAADARKAAAVNVRSTPSARPAAGATWESTLEQAANRIYG